MNPNPCNVPGCERPVKSLGYCQTHYMRVRRHGDPGGADIWSPGQGLAARFWAKVDKHGPGDCWRWTGATNDLGYGVMRPEGKRTGPTIKAHRVSLILDGRDPGDLAVLHSCDNPPCVNPAHLRSGTLAENMQDALARDRIPRGSARANTKLTEDDVREVWRLIAAGWMYKDIAAKFGVSHSNISNIARGVTWTHVTPPAARDLIAAVAESLS